ncbi:uncharacterized protein LOC111400224 [Olea europaea var. sylvestris]|uniref:uncharacterized protein LOC111400224 n=1 Tax=Olea europaea var. sylvestris TaxID=158386 RepID=UPI000C1D7F39|nr:uncharacterized protein LOC111400224 [Olea europaea var. sylvestris]
MIVVMKKSDFGQVGRKPRIDFACERHGSYRRHNYDIAQNLEGHSYAGRLTEKGTSILVNMAKKHVRPKEISYTLKQNDDTNVSTMRHVYNACQKFRLKEQAGRTQMQQLMNRLVENKYIEWHRTYMETNIVQDLFWAHPYLVDLLRAFSRVIIMDCTYKTNRYRLPLLEIRASSYEGH